MRFAIAVVVVLACKDDKPAPQQAASTAEVASAAPSASSEHHHRSCASRVRGATVTTSDVDGGVMLSVTASDDATISEIQSRAAALSTAPSDTRRGRFCPEMHEDTTRSVTNTKTGAEITLVPTNPSSVAAVRTDVRERLARGEKRPD